MARHEPPRKEKHFLICRIHITAYIEAFQFLNALFPLRLKQLGPYVFLEKHEKTNISFNNDATVDFNQIKTWFFDQSLSNGTLEDEIYTLNAIALSAAESTRWPEAVTPGDFPFLRYSYIYFQFFYRYSFNIRW